MHSKTVNTRQRQMPMLGALRPIQRAPAHLVGLCKDSAQPQLPLDHRAAVIRREVGMDRVGAKAEALCPDVEWLRDSAGQITGYHVPLKAVG